MRGFAVRFYTREGNYDLVGKNIPVFFIQDAMRFPDLVHAVKDPDFHRRDLWEFEPVANSCVRRLLTKWERAETKD